MSNSNRDISTAYGAFGEDASGYQELSENEYVLSVLMKWPALAQMNGLERHPPMRKDDKIGTSEGAP
ncbi:hypothetical protein [Zhongshania sp.]|uniref:hypothetical protein n=1 Tax=Zhongshania sp. TaxID=1971902 RepID=UPI001B75DA06|nr:hypothetical protein [Zhongshania sp.]MBQ0797163.1 hypothetical protein [Zhongshania sp.]